MQPLEPVPFKGDYINGEFYLPRRGDGDFTNISPANLNEHVCKVDFAYAHVDQACEAARRAFIEWSETPIEKRIEVMYRVRDIIERRKEEFAEIISRETGKPLWEALGEAGALVSKFNITVDQSLKLVSENRIENALPGVTGVIRYRPRGVLSVIGPFNFPAHLPNGHIVPALITGNTVVFKPSELTPMTAQIMAECYHEAKVPQGVFNLVHGLGEIGRRIVVHKDVDGILFTGSYETGQKIREATLNDYWKIHALEMGGKNSTIVWNDADIDKAIYETTIGAYLTAGQRCSGTSRVFIHKDIADEFTEKFYQHAKKLEVGHWSTNPFMGTLINKKAVDTYTRFQEIALREGAEKIMRGKQLEPGVKGYYVSPSIYRVKEYDPKSVYQNHEIFGPNLAIYAIDDIDMAIEASNQTGYGLSMAVFTKQEELYHRAYNRAKVGLLNWNRTTNGASSKLPFGGCGKSGNDRPAGNFSVYYTTVPVASLEDPTKFDPTKTFPGMHWT